MMCVENLIGLDHPSSVRMDGVTLENVQAAPLKGSAMH